MREILFRGKREDTGEWVFNLLLQDLRGNYIIDEWFTDVEPVSVGKYTGLTDKNGVKIFEGDIIKFKCYDSEFISKDGTKHTTILCDDLAEISFIEIDKNGYVISDSRPYEYLAVVYYHCGVAFFAKVTESCAKLSEVIGNIYDNPELIHFQEE